jgi:probable phosphoglycerate mutase
VSAARLLLVRHGITDWNRAGRFQGHLDPPLAEDGRTEARLLGERLRARSAAERPRRVIASSLARASETGSIVATALGIPMQTDARLMEIGQGEWEGRSHDELEREDADRYAAWRADPVARPPGAEDLALVDRRTSAAIADAVAAPGPTCLVTHGGVLRVIAAQLLDLSVRGWDLDADNCSLGVVARAEDGPWQLERWNDVHHLLGAVTTHVDEDEGHPRAL